VRIYDFSIRERQPEITLVQKTSVLRRIQMAQCYGCPQHLFRFVSARP
jgi:hypothetical protein